MDKNNLAANNDEKFEISLTVITHLVANLTLGILKFPKKVERELIQTYYNGLDKCKKNGFTDEMIIINDKPNLLEYLIDKGIIDNGEKDLSLVKVAEKIRK